MIILLNKIIAKIEKRLHEIKFREYNKNKHSRFNMLYDLSKMQGIQSLSPNKKSTRYLERHQDFAHNLERTVNAVLEIPYVAETMSKIYSNLT